MFGISCISCFPILRHIPGIFEFHVFSTFARHPQYMKSQSGIFPAYSGYIKSKTWNTRSPRTWNYHPNIKSKPKHNINKYFDIRNPAWGIFYQSDSYLAGIIFWNRGVFNPLLHWNCILTTNYNQQIFLPYLKIGFSGL